MHPVIKYAFAALLLLGATLSNQAHAGTWYQISGHYGSTATEAATSWCGPNDCTQLCGATSTADNGNVTVWYDRQSSNDDDCEYAGQPYPYGTYIVVADYAGTCPSQLPYEDPQTGQCLSEQPIQCEAGSKNIFVRYTFAESQQEGFFTNQAQIQNEGCIYDSIGIEECGIYPDGVKACLYEYTQTDTPAEGTESQPDEFTEGTAPETSQNTDTGQTTFVEDPPVTNPDGSTTQTTTETTTNTSGSGTEIWNDDDFIYVRDSTGTTTIYSRQNTTTTNTDGSVDETVVTSKTTQTPSTTTTTYNKNTGNVTNSNNTQSTTNNTTTTTNNYYDSEGNLTGSDSTTTGGSETYNEGDENKEGNCGAPGQPSCEVSLKGESALQDPQLAIQQSGVQGKLDDYIATFDTIGQGDTSSFTLDNPFNLPTTGQCNASSYDYQYHGKTLNPMTGFCQVYDAVLHPALRYFFYALTLIVLYFTFINATTRTQ